MHKKRRIDCLFYSYFDYLCKQKGVSKNKACQEMGVSRNVAAKWKSTNTNPNMKTLGRISEYFGVSIDELLKHSNEKENPATERQGLSIQLSMHSIILSQNPKEVLFFYR